MPGIGIEVAGLRKKLGPNQALDGKTPYELWYKRKPDLRHVHPFGGLVSVHVPKERRKRLDPRSWSGVMVGYELFDGGGWAGPCRQAGQNREKEIRKKMIQQRTKVDGCMLLCDGVLNRMTCWYSRE